MSRPVFSVFLSLVVLTLQGLALGQIIPQASFETPLQPGTSGFDGFEQANGTGNGTLVGSTWTFSPSAGISRNFSAFQGGGAAAADGEQLALIQRDGTINQTLNGFTPGDIYTLTFASRTRAGTDATDSRYYIDGQLISGGRVRSETMLDHTSARFVAGSATPTLTIESTNPFGGDRTLFVDHFRVNTVGPVNAPTITNPGFELGTPSTVFPEYGVVDGWATLGTGSGTNDAGGPFVNGLSIPEGSRVGFIQRDGVIRTLEQTITGLTPGETYQIELEMNERGAGAGPVARPSVTVDGNTVVAEHDSVRTGEWRRVITQPFTATGTTATLGLSNNTGSGDNTALFDNLTITSDVAPVIADGGFELPIQPGTSGFDAFEQANGTGNGTLAGSAWTFANGGGISRNTSAFQNSGVQAPEGSQISLFQGVNASATQTITGFGNLVQYELVFEAAARLAGGGNDLEIILDQGLESELVIFDSSEITNTAFAEFSSDPFIAMKDSYTLTLLGNLDDGNLTGDRTTFVDDLRFNFLAQTPEPATWLIWCCLGLLGGGFAWRKRRRK